MSKTWCTLKYVHQSTRSNVWQRKQLRVGSLARLHVLLFTRCVVRTKPKNRGAAKRVAVSAKKLVTYECEIDKCIVLGKTTTLFGHYVIPRTCVFLPRGGIVDADNLRVLLYRRALVIYNGVLRSVIPIIVWHTSICFLFRGKTQRRRKRYMGVDCVNVYLKVVKREKEYREKEAKANHLVLRYFHYWNNGSQKSYYLS